MRYRIYTKRLMYEIEIHGKYTVLYGDSGGGKSVLYEMIAAKNSGNRAVHIEVYDNGMWKPASVSFFAVAQNDAWLEFHHEKDGSVFVVDEDAAVFKHRDAASVFKKSRHPFLLITRKNLDYLPVSVENIYHLRNEGKKHFFERTYRVEYKKAFGAQDIIVTEDAGPGCRIFREFFENITVCSAETKSNVSKTVKNLPPDCKNVLVVYDAAAFGMQIKKFREMMANEHRNISVLDWYSFEHHVHNSFELGISIARASAASE